MIVKRLKLTSLSCFIFMFLVSGGISHAQLAKGANKFLGNITTSMQVRSDFGTYWDQITAENEHKWGSVEGTRDRMSWGGGDRVADYAKKNNIPWKFHTLIWGSQFPNWMNNLSQKEQLEEITEWFDETKKHYPDIPMIDVVNEAYEANGGKHAPPPWKNAIGGTGSTGFDYIVTAFKMARQRWPKAILIYNDYNTLEWPNEINWIKQTMPKLVKAGAPIDAIGFQAHGLKGQSAATLKSRLDDIWSAVKLPFYITEYDIGETNDQAQLDNYKAHITTMWNHPKVVGITIWGYIYGSTWVNGTGIIKDGKDRPSMTWLKEFIKANPNPPNDYPKFNTDGGGTPVIPVEQAKRSRDISLCQNGSSVSISLNGSNADGARLNVYDLKGTQIHSASIKAGITSGQSYSFSTAGLPAGYYVVKICSENAIEKARFLVSGK
ncbi:MAG TPA: endo-1,4-beta-xylanase [Chitinispirillaceae bacterium]|nr:endo-1,4-beta-xylanase [Chitinispirillaceae bacterium]